MYLPLEQKLMDGCKPLGIIFNNRVDGRELLQYDTLQDRLGHPSAAEIKRGQEMLNSLSSEQLSGQFPEGYSFAEQVAAQFNEETDEPFDVSEVLGALLHRPTMDQLDILSGDLPLFLRTLTIHEGN